MRRVISFLVSSLAAGALLLAAPAWAADDVAAARAHYARGTRAYNLGKYLEAAREFELAYQAKDAPELLYNLGQAYREAGEHARAITVYRSFLRSGIASDAKRAEVEGHIAASEKVLATAATPPVVDAPVQPVLQPTAPVTPVVTAPPLAIEAPLPLHRRWYVWTAVAGVVVAGTAVAVAVSTGSAFPAPREPANAGTFRF
jgi:hypothetical protein